MLLLVPMWACLAVICFAGGALAWRAFALVTPRTALVTPSAGQVFWLGFGVFLGELQVYSLFHRIDRHAWYLVIATSIGGAACALPLLQIALARLRAGGITRALARLVVLVVAWFGVGLSAIQPIGWHDTLSTHIQQVKWEIAAGCVRGLGNLNPKLGFDQAHHLIAAFADGGPYTQRSAHVAVSFILFAVLVHWGFVFTRPARDVHAVRAKIFAVLTLPYLTHKMNSLEVGSLSGDLAMSCLLLVCAFHLVGAPAACGQQRRRTHLALLTAATCGAAVFAIKLSGMLFATTAMALSAWYLLTSMRDRRDWRRLVPAALPLLLVFGTLARRAILTGWLLFPYPSFALPFSWTVTEAATVDQYIWIKSWARLPGVSAHEVLDGSFWRWFVPWFEGFRHQHEHSLLMWSGVVILVQAGLRTSRDPCRSPFTRWVLVAAIASLVHWFTGAPDLRFGGVFFWVLFASAWIPVLSVGSHVATHGRALVLVVGVWMLGWHGGFDVVPAHEPAWVALPIHPSFDTQLTTIDPGTPAGYSVRVPVKNGDLCGDVALPCTPYPANGRLRIPAHLERGFAPR